MTTVTAQQTAADLLSAANHLEQFGWRKGDLGEPGRPCCVDGAINVAIHGDFSYYSPDSSKQQQIHAAHRAFDEFLGDDETGPSWNDDEGRTAAEAVAKLREAAEAVFPSV